MSSLRLALIGFGMSGVGALHALRHRGRFTTTPDAVHPEITVFEAAPVPGGKAAPENLGAQFLDADALYPFDRILADLRLATHRVRQDYELVRLRLRNQPVIEAKVFREALVSLREALLRALQSMPFAALDAMSVPEFLDRLRQRGAVTDEGRAAMRQRMLLEDGTTRLSALAYALSLAKTPTPVRRLEVVGGLHAVAVRERAAAAAEGVTFRMESAVKRLDVARDAVRVWSAAGTEEFDRAILCVSPEHLARIKISGKPLPLAPLARMTPARISKSNLLLHGTSAAEEHATERYALWATSRKAPRRAGALMTFFHGWEGQAPLSMWHMVKVVTGTASASRLAHFSSRTWDATPREGELPMAYVTEPAPGETVPLLRFARDLYFRGRHDASPLAIASHALAIGANVREAALTGEWAVVALLRGLGHDVSPALHRNIDPERELFGAPRGLLARELDGAPPPPPRKPITKGDPQGPP